MKILVLHNAYQQRGGEDGVVDAETALLREAGHEVAVEIVRNHDLSGVGPQLRAFLTAPHDPGRRRWASDLVRAHAPDVVHIHNFFPRLTPAVHEGASDAGAAVVQTLHNFRLACANAMLLRNGAVCEKCVHGTAAWGVLHRCYRGSVAGSLAVVRMQARARRARTWANHVDRFIALTEFARRKFEEAGLPAERLTVKPNFVAPRGGSTGPRRRQAVFIGRLSREKGAHILIEAWRAVPDLPLVVVGDGPERQALEASAPPNVAFTGGLRPDAVREHLAQSLCLVAPSIWYEGFPLVAAEAFEAGVPILASRIGGLGEIVRHEVNGLHFEPGDPTDLASVVQRFASDAGLQARLRAGASADYETRYTPQVNLHRLLEIYVEATEARSGRAAATLSKNHG